MDDPLFHNDFENDELKNKCYFILKLLDKNCYE